MNNNTEERPLKVSVRCIAYNQESYIRQCLEGFVMQKTNFRFEAIVHDDASTDGTAEIIREYADKFPDIIKPIIETENQYSKRDGSLRRIMNDACKGEYIAVCEGDDYWTDPLKLQKQVDYLDGHPECGLVYTDIDIYHQETGIVEKSVFKTGKRGVITDFTTELLMAGYIAPCSWMYRREFQGKPNKYVDGTFPMALDIMAQSQVHFLDDTTTVYRRLRNSACHSLTYRKRYFFGKGVYQIQLDYAEKYKVAERYRKQIDTLFYSGYYTYCILNDDLDLVKKGRLFFSENSCWNGRNRFVNLFSYNKCGRVFLRKLYDITIYIRSHWFKIEGFD